MFGTAHAVGHGGQWLAFSWAGTKLAYSGETSDVYVANLETGESARVAKKTRSPRVCAVGAA
jgi:hypothetical protein